MLLIRITAHHREIHTFKPSVRGYLIHCMTTEKGRLRARSRECRASLSPERCADFSRRIHDHLFSLLDGSDPVMVYVSKPPEVDTHPFISRLISRGTGVVVPIIERETRTLRLSFLRDPSVLSVSTFSVPEPIGHEIPARARDIPVVIVPLIAFDRHGHRLGYGAGYYDRFLSAYPHLRKIGVAFSCQEVESVPADENDVALDFIVTENGVIQVCSGRTS
jgi:5-formyltetrahydrofolate cyclo-ligase